MNLDEERELLKRLPHEPRCRGILLDAPLLCDCAKKELEKKLDILEDEY